MKETLNKLTLEYQRATKITDDALKPPVVEKTIRKNPYTKKSCADKK